MAKGISGLHPWPQWVSIIFTNSSLRLRSVIYLVDIWCSNSLFQARHVVGNMEYNHSSLARSWLNRDPGIPPYPNTPSTAWYKPIKSSRAPNWAAAWWSAGPQTSVRWRPRCDWACSPRSTTGAKPGEDGHKHGEISHHSWDITGYTDIDIDMDIDIDTVYSIQYIYISIYLYWYITI